MITAANEPLQDPVKVGTGLKTIAMRLAGVTTKAKDGSVEISKTGKALKEIAGIDVYADHKTGQVKTVVQLFDELHDKWGQLRDDERKGLSEAISGKERADIFTALMSNYDTFTQMRREFEDGLHFGSAEAENAKYVDSLEGKINRLRETFTSLASTVLNTKSAYGFFDMVNKGAEKLDDMVQFGDKLGIKLPMAMASLIGLRAFRKGITPTIKSWDELLTGKSDSKEPNLVKKIKAVKKEFKRNSDDIVDLSEKLNKRMDKENSKPVSKNKSKGIGNTDGNVLSDKSGIKNDKEAIATAERKDNILKKHRKNISKLSEAEKQNHKMKLRSLPLADAEVRMAEKGEQVHRKAIRNKQKMAELDKSVTLQKTPWVKKGVDSSGLLDGVKSSASLIGDKAIGIGKGLLTGFTNAFTGMAVAGVASIALTKSIEFASKKYKEYTTGIETNKEKHIEQRDALMKENNSLKSNIDYVKKNANAIDTLHSRKKALLSIDEKNRSAEQNKELDDIRNLENKIAQISPNSVRGYDDEGNPIIRDTVNAKNLTKTLEILQRTKQRTLDNKNKNILSDNEKLFRSGNTIGQSLAKSIESNKRKIKNGLGELTFYVSDAIKASDKSLNKFSAKFDARTGAIKKAPELQTAFKELVNPRDTSIGLFKNLGNNSFQKRLNRFNSAYTTWKNGMDKNFSDANKTLEKYDKINAENTQIQMDIMSRDKRFKGMNETQLGNAYNVGGLFQWGKMRRSDTNGAFGMLEKIAKVEPSKVDNVTESILKLRDAYDMDKDYGAYKSGIEKQAEKLGKMAGLSNREVKKLAENLTDVERTYRDLDEALETSYMRKHGVKPSDMEREDGLGAYAQKVQEQYKNMASARDKWRESKDGEDRKNFLREISENAEAYGSLSKIAKGLLDTGLNKSGTDLTDTASTAIEKLMEAHLAFEPEAKNTAKILEGLNDAFKVGAERAVDLGNGIRLSREEVQELTKAGVTAGDVKDFLTGEKKQIYDKLDNFYDNYKTSKGKKIEIPFDVKMVLAKLELSDNELSGLEKLVEKKGLSGAKANEFRVDMGQFFKGTNGDFEKAYENMGKTDDGRKKAVLQNLTQEVGKHNKEVLALGQSYSQLNEKMKNNVKAMNPANFGNYLKEFGKLSDRMKNFVNSKEITNVATIKSLSGIEQRGIDAGVKNETITKSINVVYENTGAEGLEKINSMLAQLPDQKVVKIMTELSGQGGDAKARGLGYLFESGASMNDVILTVNTVLNKSGDLQQLTELQGAEQAKDFIINVKKEGFDTNELKKDTESKHTVKGDNSDVEKNKEKNKEDTESKHTVKGDNGDVEKNKEKNKEDTQSTHKTNLDNSEVESGKEKNKKNTESTHKVKFEDVMGSTTFKPKIEKPEIPKINPSEFLYGTTLPPLKPDVEPNTSKVDEVLGKEQKIHADIEPTSNNISDIIGMTNPEIEVTVRPNTDGLSSELSGIQLDEIEVPIRLDDSTLTGLMAIQAPPVEVPLIANTEGIESSISSVSSQEVKVNLTADASNVVSSISAVSLAPIEIPATLDTTFLSGAYDINIPPVEVPLIAETSGLSEIYSITVDPVEVPLTANTDSISASIATIGMSDITVHISADTSEITSSISAITLAPVKVPAILDTTTLAGAYNIQVPPVKVPLTADTASLNQAISGLSGSKNVKVNVDADTTGARAKIDALNATKTVKVTVGADVSGVNEQISAISNRSVTVTVNAKVNIPKIESKSVTLTAIDNASEPAQTATSAVNAFPTADKTETLIAVDNASAPARTATGAVNAFPTGSKTMRLITIHETQYKTSFSGGIYKQKSTENDNFDERVKKIENLRNNLNLRLDVADIPHRPTQMNPLATDIGGYASMTSDGYASTMATGSGAGGGASGVAQKMSIIEAIEAFKDFNLEPIIYKGVTMIGKLTYSAKEMREAFKHNVDVLTEMDFALNRLDGSIKIVDARMNRLRGSAKVASLEVQNDLIREQRRRIKSARDANEQVKLLYRQMLKEIGVEFTKNGAISHNYAKIMLSLKKEELELEKKISKAKNDKLKKELDEKKKELERKIRLFDEYKKASDKEVEYDFKDEENQNKILENDDEKERIRISAWREHYEAVNKVIENSINAINRELDIYNAKYKYAFGYDKLTLMNKQVEGFKKMQDQVQANVVTLERMRDSLKGKLSSYGFTFSGDQFTNYEKHLAELKNTSRVYEEVKSLANDYFDLINSRIPDSQKTIEEFNSRIKDMSKERLESTKTIEDKISAMYKKHIDERIKLTEKANRSKEEEIKKRKEAYNLARKEAEYQDAYHKKLEEIEKLERKKEIYKKDTSQKGQKELQKINKELEKQVDDLQKTVGKHVDDKVNKIFDDELNAISESTKNMKEKYENEYTDTEILKKAQEAISTGIFTDIDGQVMDLQTALMDYINEFEGGLSATGSVIQGEIIAKLEIANDTVKNFSSTLNELGTSSFNTGGYIQSGEYQKIQERQKSNQFNYNAPLVYVQGSTDSQLNEELLKTVERAMDKHLRELKGNVY